MVHVNKPLIVETVQIVLDVLDHQYMFQYQYQYNLFHKFQLTVTHVQIVMDVQELTKVDILLIIIKIKEEFIMEDHLEVDQDYLY